MVPVQTGTIHILFSDTFVPISRYDMEDVNNSFKTCSIFPSALCKHVITFSEMLDISSVMVCADCNL